MAKTSTRQTLPSSVLYGFGALALVAGIVTLVVFLMKKKKNEEPK